MHVRGSEWSVERVEKLKGLHAAGLSCSRMAAEIGGVSRNAVIGKLHRLGLSNAASTVRRDNQYGRKPRKPAEKTVRVVRASAKDGSYRLMESARIAVQEIRCADVTPLNLGLLDLDPHQCRYPVNDEPFLFCGHSKMEGASYCAPHFMLTHRSEADRKAKVAEAA
jgi:GcrA cell cycle regulator